MIIIDNKSCITDDGKFLSFNVQAPPNSMFGSSCYFSRGIWIYNQDTIDLNNLANNHGGDMGTPNNTNYLYGPDNIWKGLYVRNSNQFSYKNLQNIISLSDLSNVNTHVKPTDILFISLVLNGIPSNVSCKYNDGLIIFPVYQKSLVTKWLSNSARALLNGDPADYTNHIHNIMLATAIDNAGKAGKFNLMIEYWNEFLGKRTLYDECLYSETESFKSCNCK